MTNQNNFEKEKVGGVALSDFTLIEILQGTWWCDYGIQMATQINETEKKVPKQTNTYTEIDILT